MFRFRHVAPLLWPALLGVLTQSAAAATDWRDLESRIQYAWYTEDARELASAESGVRALSDPDPQRAYYLTLVQMREAQLPGDPARAARAASACVESADAALADRPTDAELLALQSWCMELRSQVRGVGVPFAAARTRAQMQRAQQLGARNPRVRLLSAQLAYAQSKTTAERAKQLAAFQSAVDAFELERQGLEHIPAWGAAEAWEGLAQVYLDRGDAIAARSALEHALLLMPDYKSAHRLLNHIVMG